MITTQLKLLEFLDELRRGTIQYRLSQHRTDAIMVEIAVPGERWEVEFLEDGTVEAEVFRSSGNIEGVEAVATLLAKHSDTAGALERAPDSSL
jgi:hypothetical protein